MTAQAKHGHVDDVATVKQRFRRHAQLLGLPLRRRGGRAKDQLLLESEGPTWRRRPELADMAAVGPVLDEAWRWSA